MRIQIVVILLNIISISSFSQETDNNKKTINFQPSPSTEFSFKCEISNRITIGSIHGFLWLNDSLNVTDSLHSITENVKIKLKSGTTWDPGEGPPQTKFLFFKVLFNKLDSTDTDSLNYLELITAYENSKINGLKMIDYLYFSESYLDSRNKKQYSVDYYLRPNNDGKLLLTEKIITYCQNVND